jgi:hypothetical protein
MCEGDSASEEVPAKRRVGVLATAELDPRLRQATLGLSRSAGLAVL